MFFKFHPKGGICFENSCMLIDIVLLALMALALFKGFSRGFIIATFSLLAFIIGIAAAMKLSAMVAGYLSATAGVTGQWLPVFSFMLVFIGVVFFVKWGAAIIKKAVSFVLLGWVDKLAGVLLYAVLYVMILSVLLFYASKVGLIPADMQQASASYPYIEPWAPRIIDGIGKVIPWFSDMFKDLSGFFERAGNGANGGN